MNILFINDLPANPILGGIERVTCLVAEGLIKRGHNIYFLSGKIHNKSYVDFELGDHQIELPDYNLFKSVENKKFYKNIIETHKIDFIINQRGLNNNLNYSLQCDNVKKISVLHSAPKSYLAIDSRNYLGYKRTFIGYIKLIIKLFLYFPRIFLHKERTKAKLKSQFNFIANKSDAVVLLSNQFKKEFYSFCETNVNLCAIHNPCPFENEIQYPKEKIILFVGRLDPYQKNPLELIKIWRKLYKKHMDWKLVFVGDGLYKDEMKSYLKKHQVLNVEFMGAVKDVESIYKISSIICLTSRFEGWGMVLVEGMAYGCIPIAYNSYAALQDIIQDKENGIIIKNKNRSQYIEMLSILMNDSNLRNILSKNAINSVKKFSLDKISSDWESLFKSLK